MEATKYQSVSWGKKYTDEPCYFAKKHDKNNIGFMLFLASTILSTEDSNLFLECVLHITDEICVLLTEMQATRLNLQSVIVHRRLLKFCSCSL